MYIKYENHYLTDNDIANAARQSFGKLANQFSTEQNEKLIKFLARGVQTNDWESLINQFINLNDKKEIKTLLFYIRSIPEHWVPFGHPHITVSLSAPVPVARQLFKHKIGFVESEESRRYVSHKPEIFIPECFRSKAESVKQGSGGIHPRNDYWMDAYKYQTAMAVHTYLDAIDSGVCPEQARFFLPQGAEVRWILTGSLYAFANMYVQRTDSHVQEETRTLAKQLDGVIQPLYPIAWNALTKGQY